MARRLSEISTTQFKVDFNGVLDQATEEGAVYITRWKKPQFVLMTYDYYMELTSHAKDRDKTNLTLVSDE